MPKAKKRGMSPTARTLKLFREKDFRMEVVERFIPGIGIRKDFLSCIDILGMREGKKRIVGVQCFSTAWTEHERKICKEFPDGGAFWLSLKRTDLVFVGWRKLKLHRGSVAVRWKPRFGIVKKGKKKDQQQGELILVEVNEETFWEELLG